MINQDGILNIQLYFLDTNQIQIG